MLQTAIANVRFVAVSATIPNAADIAHWLGAPPQGLLTFGEEVRPVRLQTVVRGYSSTKTDFLFERRLDDHLPGIISEFSCGQPSLIFCWSGSPPQRRMPATLDWHLGATAKSHMVSTHLHHACPGWRKKKNKSFNTSRWMRIVHA